MVDLIQYAPINKRRGPTAMAYAIDLGPCIEGALERSVEKRHVAYPQAVRDRDPNLRTDRNGSMAIA